MSDKDDLNLSYGKSKSAFPNIVFIGIAGLVLVGVGFGGGMIFERSHKKTTTTTASGSTLGVDTQGGFGGGPRNFNRQPPIMGSVSEINASSITLQDSTSSTTKTYSLDSSTTITNNRQPVTVADVKVGDTVAIIVNASFPTRVSRILVNPPQINSDSGPPAQ